MEEENKELKRTLKIAAREVETIASDDDKTDLNTTAVTTETDATPEVSQEGIEISEDAFSRVAYTVTKAQDTVVQWIEKLPMCVPDDAEAAVGK